MYSTFSSIWNIVSLLGSFTLLLVLMFGCGVGFSNLCLPVRFRNFRWFLTPVLGCAALLFLSVKLNTFWWGLAKIVWPCALFLLAWGGLSFFWKERWGSLHGASNVFPGPDFRQSLTVFATAYLSSVIYLSPLLFLGDKGLFGLGGGDFSYYMGIGDKLQDRPFLRYRPQAIFGNSPYYQREYREDPEELRDPPSPGWQAEAILWLNHHHWSCPAGWVVLPGVVQGLKIADRLTSYTLLMALLPFLLTLTLYCFCRVVFQLDHAQSLAGCLLTAISPAMAWVLYAHFYPHYVSLFVPMAMILILWGVDRIEASTVVTGALLFFMIWSIYPHTLQLHALALLPLFLFSMWKQGKQRIRILGITMASVVLISVLGYSVAEMSNSIMLKHYFWIVVEGAQHGIQPRTQLEGIPVPMKWWAFYAVGSGLIDPTRMYSWNYEPLAQKFPWFESSMHIFTVLAVLLALVGAWLSKNKPVLITVTSIYVFLFTLSRTVLYLRPYHILKAYLYLTPYYMAAAGAALIPLVRHFRSVRAATAQEERGMVVSALRQSWYQLLLAPVVLGLWTTTIFFRGYFTYDVVTGNDHAFIQLEASNDFANALERIHAYPPLSSRTISVFYDQYLNLPAMDMLLHHLPFESFRTYDYIGGRGHYDPTDMVQPDAPMLWAFDKQLGDVTALTDDGVIWQNDRWVVFKTGDGKLRQALIGRFWNSPQYLGTRKSTQRIYRYLNGSAWFGIWSPQEQEVWIETQIAITGDAPGILEMYLNPPIGITGAQTLPGNREELNRIYGPGKKCEIVLPPYSLAGSYNLTQHTRLLLRKGFNRILLTSRTGEKRGREANSPIVFWIDTIATGSRPVLHWSPPPNGLINVDGDAGTGQLWCDGRGLPKLRVSGWISREEMNVLSEAQVQIFVSGDRKIGQSLLTWSGSTFTSDVSLAESVLTEKDWKSKNGERYLEISIKLAVNPNPGDGKGIQLSASKIQIHNVSVANQETNTLEANRRYTRRVQSGFNENVVRWWEKEMKYSPKPLAELRP